MLKVGISYISYNRLDILGWGLNQLYSETFKKYNDKIKFVFSISDDNSDNIDKLNALIENIPTMENLEVHVSLGLLGNISHQRNRSLTPLYDAKCDYIFMFEDDIFPINEKWLDVYMSALDVYPHVMYLPKTIFPHERILSKHVSKKGETFNLTQNKQCGGIMLGVKGDLFQRIGGFDARFGPYGYEHAEYTERCNRALGKPFDYYLSVSEAVDEKWFLSLDEYNHTGFCADIDRKEFEELRRGSISQRLSPNDIQESIRYNMGIWNMSKQETNQGKYFRKLEWKCQ